MKNLSEQELVVLAQGGNQRALSTLLDKMRPTMISSMSRTFNQIDIATIEDLIQDSFVKVFRKLDKYSPTYSFNTWLTTICRNTIIDSQRKIENKVTRLSLDHSGFDSDTEEDLPTLGSMIECSNLTPIELMEKEDRCKVAHKLLVTDSIPSKLQNVAYLRYMDELSYDEISEQTNIPLGTIKARLFRFRELAKELV